jgi:hypothetical protein
MSEDVPLIYTTLGNLPINSLDYSYSWEDTKEFTKFTETYSLNGTIVKQSCHVYSRILFPINIEQGEI